MHSAPFCRYVRACRGRSGAPPAALPLQPEAFAVGALDLGGVGFMRADLDRIQCAVVVVLAVVGALRYGALDGFVRRTGTVRHCHYLPNRALFGERRDTQQRFFTEERGGNFRRNSRSGVLRAVVCALHGKICGGFYGMNKYTYMNVYIRAEMGQKPQERGREYGMNC